jgi:hypothetical protein
MAASDGQCPHEILQSPVRTYHTSGENEIRELFSLKRAWFADCGRGGRGFRTMID